MRVSGKQQRRETACSVGVEWPLRMLRRALLVHLSRCEANSVNRSLGRTALQDTRIPQRTIRSFQEQSEFPCNLSQG